MNTRKKLTFRTASSSSADTRSGLAHNRRAKLADTRPAESVKPVEEQFDDWLGELQDQRAWLVDAGVIAAMQALMTPQQQMFLGNVQAAAPANAVGAALLVAHQQLRADILSRLPRRFPGEPSNMYEMAAALVADVALGEAFADTNAAMFPAIGAKA